MKLKNEETVSEKNKQIIYEDIVRQIKEAGKYEDLVIEILSALVGNEELVNPKDNKSLNTNLPKDKEWELQNNINEIIEISNVEITPNLSLRTDCSNSEIDLEYYRMGDRKALTGKDILKIVEKIPRSSKTVAAIDLALLVLERGANEIKKKLKEIRLHHGKSNSLIRRRIKDPLILEFAALADDVYNVNQHNDGLGEWKPCREEIEEETGNVNWEVLNAFTSNIYKKTVKDVSTYAYVIKGTNIFKFNDLKEDLLILFNRKDYQQYSDIAIKNSEIIKTVIGNSKLFFVGHSLGGAIASKCAEHFHNQKKAKNNYRAYTFNPLTNHIGNEDYIQSYILYNDFVNIFQDLIGKRADGHKYYIMNKDNILISHKIATIIEILDNLKPDFFSFLKWNN